MLKKQLYFFILSGAIILTSAHAALAGFGVSPPAVISDKILPGSHFEQRVTLLRSSAESVLNATVEINAPEIEEWITINKGMTFELPAGIIQVPIIINIDAPKDAAIDSYSGKININVAEKNNTGASGIELGVGAQINLDIRLTCDIYRDFLVRATNIIDLELPKKPWDQPIFSSIFRRLQVSLKIENTGNIEIAPSKVTLDIYDISEENLLETVTDFKIKKIQAFQTKDVLASFPVQIDAGQYWAKVRVYKGNDIIASEKIAFTIMPAGAFKISDLLPWSAVFA